MRAHAVRRSSCSASEGPNCRHTSVATLLTLVFLLALYVAWFRIRRPDPDARVHSDPGPPAMITPPPTLS
jgi:hypothetical protein